MGEFFKSGRRTIGIVALALSLAFMGMWLRSISETDIITLPVGRLPLVIFVSRGGSFALTWADSSPNHAFPGWNASSQYVSLSDCGYLFDFSGGKRDWRGLNAFGIALISFAAPSPQPTPLDATNAAEPSGEPSIDDAQDAKPLETAASIPDASSTTFVARQQPDATGQIKWQVVPQNANGTTKSTSSTTGVIVTGAPPSITGSFTGSVPLTLALQSPGGTKPFALWAIPYWTVVACLTLLSAYLLLRKPSVAKPVIGS